MSVSKTAGPVLVVDDDDDIREALRDLLADEGYSIAEASDGGTALDYLASHAPPALILLDWNMAPMNGAQFMDEFQKKPAASAVPVVLVTADVRASESAVSRGFAARLKKPVRLPDLFAVLEMYCARAGLQSQPDGVPSG